MAFIDIPGPSISLDSFWPGASGATLVLVRAALPNSYEIELSNGLIIRYSGSGFTYVGDPELPAGGAYNLIEILNPSLSVLGTFSLSTGSLPLADIYSATSASAFLTGSDLLTLGSGNDTLDGGSGSDTISGGWGSDSLYGGADSDTIYTGRGYDDQSDLNFNFADGGAGTDTLLGAGGIDELHGGADLDYLYGGSAGDFLFGEGGNDQLYGNSGNDTLDGGEGNDFLEGQDGADTLIGGSGADRFNWSSLSFYSTATNFDRILDFNPAGENDRLQITTPRPAVFRGELTGFTFTIGEALPGSDVGPGFSQIWWARIGNPGAERTLLISDTNDNFILDTSDFVVEFSGTSPASLSVQDFTNTLFVTAGTTGNDIMDGTANSDHLYGAGGDDTINGLLGPDNIYGGAGHDTLYGNEDHDTLYGGGDHDTLYGGGGLDVLFGEAGSDALFGGDDSDTLYTGSNYGDFLDTTSNYAYGDGGRDFLFGSSGADELHGGADNDVLRGGSGNDSMSGDDGGDFLEGDDGNDTLDGGNGNDSLLGENGNDTLYGSAGSDTIEGGAGSDDMLGGGDNDSFVWALSSQHSTAAAYDRVLDFNPAGEADRIQISAPRPATFRGEIAAFNFTIGAALPGSDLGTGFSQLWWARIGNPGEERTLLISDLNDNFILDSTDFVVEFSGTSPASLAAADFATGAFANVGTPGDDTFNGTNLSDTYYGATGNDTINGSGGSDFLRGQAGNDTINGDDGHDWIEGGDNNDTLNGGTGFDQMFGGIGSDTLNGGADSDEIYTGRSSNDVLDALYNFADGGSGADEMYGAAGVDELHGGSENDYIIGFNGNDLLYGDGGDDQLYGENLNDTIDGGDGNDYLNGGLNADILTGGTGNDRFAWSTNHSTAASFDRVLDFNPSGENDRLEISVSRPAVFRGEITGFNFTVGAALPGSDIGTGFSQIWWARVASSGAMRTLLIHDTNDNFVLDSTDFVVEFSGTSPASLSAQDFAGTFATAGTQGDDAIDGTTSFETIYALAGNDTIHGFDGFDTIYGGSGNDAIFGDGDRDVLFGDIGSDAIYGGDGDDDILTGRTTGDTGDTSNNLAEGGNGFDRLYGAGGVDELHGGADEDQLYGYNGGDLLYGDAGNDYLSGDAGNDVLNGGEGNDQLIGSSGNDTADYNDAGSAVSVDLRIVSLAQNTIGAGFDTLSSVENVIGSAFDDTLISDTTAVNILTGGLGNDRYYIWQSSDLIVENAGQGTADRVDAYVNYNLASASEIETFVARLTSGMILGGSDTANRIVGESGNDTLNGNGGDDTLEGLAGNDTLTGGTGNDRLDGGSDTDTASYAGAASGVTVSLLLAGAQDTIGAGLDTLVSIENLTGSGQADTLTGNNAANLINGGAGNDTINGRGGADAMTGGAGDDRFYVDNAGDTTTETGAQGTDRVYASVNYTLGAGQSIEFLYGNAGATGLTLTGNELANNIQGNGGIDTLNGGGGDDILDGRGGADDMTGGGGNDRYYVDNASDVIHEGSADGALDFVYASVDYTLANGQYIERLYANVTTGLTLQGNDFVNSIFGASGADTLMGHAGADTLTGNAGNDRLIGGAGIDTLFGNAGTDVFVLSNVAADRDGIRDFAAEDQIEISASLFGGGLVVGSLAAIQFASNATGVATDTDQRFIYNNTNGALYFDIDGNGAGARVQIASLTGIPALTAADFSIVA